MKILSFDVGINNLSYCVLDHSLELLAEKPKIVKWGIISLVPENADRACQGKLKINLNICNKKASYYNKITDKNYCKKHCPDGSSLIKKKKLATFPLNELIIRLHRSLDALSESKEVNHVYIENQPVLRNPRMKTISDAIYNYYVIRGMIDSQQISEVSYVSAKHKLTVYDGPKVECKLKGKYAQTKKLAIEYCRYMIGNDSENLKLFTEQKKKDDLADSYLMGVYAFQQIIKKKKKEIKQILKKKEREEKKKEKERKQIQKKKEKEERAEKKKQSFSREELIEWSNNKTINPRTGRKIKVDGVVYKELVKEVFKI